MPAMHDDVLNAMEEELSVKKNLMLRLLSFDMTHEECIRLIAPAEHIPILTQAAKYADIKSSEDWVTLSVPADVDGCADAKVMLMMRTHAQKEPPLKPRHPYWQLPNDPEAFAAGEKVLAWIIKRHELGRKFGLARHVLRTLNKRCDNGHQLRYMLPPVLHLCKAGKHERMDRWISKHTSYRPCKATPGLSPQLRRAIQDTAVLLTQCTLIGEDIPTPTVGEVVIDDCTLGAFRFDGDLVPRM